jgi:hypothetical protein
MTLGPQPAGKGAMAGCSMLAHDFNPLNILIFDLRPE